VRSLNISAVHKFIARSVLIAAVLLAAVGCGMDTSTTFNADGSVTVGLKLLFPKTLMQGSSGTTVSGLTPAEIASANAQLKKKYPGGKIAVVTEGDEQGALITVPFKTEKDAFAFLTQPSTLSPSGATSGSGVGSNLACPLLDQRSEPMPRPTCRHIAQDHPLIRPIDSP